MNTSLSASDSHEDSLQLQRSMTKPRRPFINYEALVWTVYSIIIVLSVVDRFAWNVWPRQTHRIGAGFAGKDKIDGLIEGPWSVTLYDIIARVSGRFSIFSLNLLFYTMMHTAESALAESWVARNIVDFSNVVEANIRLHKWNGITLAVMTIVHVWSILFPPIFHGWRATVAAGTFEWILSERKPPGFKDIDLANETVGLQVDDVFRIVEMTILLVILLPLSVRWLSTRWHAGVQLHRFISVIYFIDIVRRHTHPHSWILNTPFFVFSVADLMVGWYWRRLKNPDMYRIRLSDDYILLFWNQMDKSDTVGPKFFLRLNDSSLLERAHVFTGFQNRRNLDLADGNSWTSCLLIRVYHSKRRPRLGRKDKISHTHRVAEATDLDVSAWGPYYGSMSVMVKRSMEDAQPLALVAGGSAAGYLIDAVQQHRGFESTNLTILYTSRDAALFEWVVKVMTDMLKTLRLENLHIVIALTDGGKADDAYTTELIAEKQKEIDGELSCSSSDKGRATMRVQYGRIQFADDVPKESVVYFQGSGGLQKAVEKQCKAKNCRFVAGEAFDQDQTKRRNILQAIRMNCLHRDDRIV